MYQATPWTQATTQSVDIDRYKTGNVSSHPLDASHNLERQCDRISLPRIMYQATPWTQATTYRMSNGRHQCS